MYETKKIGLFGESAVSLRNGKREAYSFSRAERFRRDRGNSGSEFVQLASTFGKRAAGFGYGKRWTPEVRSFSPAPNLYCLPSTFCVSLGGYKKDNGVKVTERFSQSPGPGTYELPSLIGKDSPKFSMRPKIDINRYLKAPSPNTYLINLAQTQAFKNLSLGVGERALGLTNKRTPSPGSEIYDLRSLFLKKKC